MFLYIINVVTLIRSSHRHGYSEGSEHIIKYISELSSISHLIWSSVIFTFIKIDALESRMSFIFLGFIKV